MTAQAWAWVAFAAAAALALAAGLAERARTRRRDLDNPGWVPWQTVAYLAMLAALVFGVVALTGSADSLSGMPGIPPRF